MISISSDRKQSVCFFFIDLLFSFWSWQHYEALMLERLYPFFLFGLPDEREQNKMTTTNNNSLRKAAHVDELSK